MRSRGELKFKVEIILFTDLIPIVIKEDVRILLDSCNLLFHGR
jgi:hypothetical protein